MALPLSGLKELELLKIETEKVKILIKGKPIHPKVEELELNRTDEGVWQEASIKIVSYGGSYKAYVFDPFIESEGQGFAEYIPGTPTFPCFYENQTYNILIQGKEGTNISFYHENKYLREAVGQSFDKNILVGNLNFSSDIGLSELIIKNHGQDYIKIQIEVFPNKIDYKKDFTALLQEVNEEIYNLAYDHLRRTYFSAKLKPNVKASLNEFFNIISLIFKQLIKALERIGLNPHHKIIVFENVNRIEKIRKFDAKSAQWLAKRSELMVPNESNRGIMVKGKHYLPEKLRESKKVISYDTFENRFVKWVMEKVIKQLKSFQREYVKLYSKDSTRYDKEVDDRLSRMQLNLQRKLQSEFLQEVSKLNHLNNLSLVLQMAPGYREVYRYYLMLTKGLSIQSDIFKISVKQLWELYEYWCFLSLNKLLRKKYKLTSHDMIKATNTGLVVKIKKDKTTTLKYENPLNGEKFQLSYQDFNRGPTLSQEPDNMLTLKKANSKIEYKYVLDAKYRVNTGYDKAYFAKYGKPGPEESDINTMHRYRDAIVYGTEDKGYEKKVYGAFVLFPYADSKKYSGEIDGKPHKFYESIERINIGGLPFLPGNTELVEKFLDELILDSEDTALEKAIFHEGTEKYYYEKFLKKNVLVGSLKSKEQWEINFAHRFYHIPLRQVVNTLGNLEYVAIYKSKLKFGEEYSGILHYGKIKRSDIVKRSQIKEIPKKSAESYVRFEIEEWKELSHSIKPLHYGVYDCLFTTLPLLLSAKELPELKLETEEEQRLWKELMRYDPKLKTIGSKNKLDDAKVKEIVFGKGVIEFIKDSVVCQRDGKQLIRSIEDVGKRRIETFKEIRFFLVN